MATTIISIDYSTTNPPNDHKVSYKGKVYLGSPVTLTTDPGTNAYVRIYGTGGNSARITVNGTVNAKDLTIQSGNTMATRRIPV
ncbi:MAG: DUF748 domain-containing protein [Armatimonadetes bacterium]|nr:DUF748 domain-containing protein [Armatimonadota bacterium]